jgi:hypothetical protein
MMEVSGSCIARFYLHLSDHCGQELEVLPTLKAQPCEQMGHQMTFCRYAKYKIRYKVISNALLEL